MDLNDLLMAAIFFVGTHLAISSSPLRPQLVARIGMRGYRALYSLVSLAALLWLISAYNNADTAPLAFAHNAFRHLTMTLMPFAIFLLVAGNSVPNPTAVGQNPDPDTADTATGIIRVTRHPTMWAIGIWAILHTLANADTASLIFFGSIAFLALGGAHFLDARRSRENAPGWGVFLQQTSFVPFLAILQGRQRFVWVEIGWLRVAVALVLYALILFGHDFVSGVSLIG